MQQSDCSQDQLLWADPVAVPLPSLFPAQPNAFCCTCSASAALLTPISSLSIYCSHSELSASLYPASSICSRIASPRMWEPLGAPSTANIPHLCEMLLDTSPAVQAAAVGSLRSLTGVPGNCNALMEAGAAPALLKLLAVASSPDVQVCLTYHMLLKSAQLSHTLSDYSPRVVSAWVYLRICKARYPICKRLHLGQLTLLLYLAQFLSEQ